MMAYRSNDQAAMRRQVRLKLAWMLNLMPLLSRRAELRSGPRRIGAGAAQGLGRRRRS